MQRPYSRRGRPEVELVVELGNQSTGRRESVDRHCVNTTEQTASDHFQWILSQRNLTQLW
ncbi:hypothetical protein FMEAI12_3350014 [Parafrankia sp. Ea1.12]|nr:hypothetical protein FMEAI12_3350014 [Parafrankia sp. Ea1.12]